MRALVVLLLFGSGCVNHGRRDCQTDTYTGASLAAARASTVAEVALSERGCVVLRREHRADGEKLTVVRETGRLLGDTPERVVEFSIENTGDHETWSFFGVDGGVTRTRTTEFDSARHPHRITETVVREDGTSQTTQWDAGGLSDGAAFKRAHGFTASPE